MRARYLRGDADAGGDCLRVYFKCGCGADFSINMCVATGRDRSAGADVLRPIVDHQQAPGGGPPRVLSGPAGRAGGGTRVVRRGSNRPGATAVSQIYGVVTDDIRLTGGYIMLCARQARFHTMSF